LANKKWACPRFLKLKHERAESQAERTVESESLL